MVVEIKKNVWYVGSIHWDRRLFDELIPLPEGTSYNAYLVKGSEKIALVDTVDPTKEYELINNLKKLKVKNIDYIISNHAEQDHSGAIPVMLEMYPNCKIVTNEKCKSFLKDLLLIPEEKFLVVKEGDILSLGDKTFEFIITPWVHWPETMVTYLKEERILFTCDLFGSHYATSKLLTNGAPQIYESAKRYYAEIMMPFRSSIKNHIKKLENLPIDIIAPSHGPLYTDASFIIEAYKDWISDNVRNEVLIPYVSMHYSTKKLVEYLIDKLTERNIQVKPFNLTVTDIGDLVISLVDAATLIMGTPMVLAGPHPLVFYVSYLVRILRPKTQFISLIGSYEWGGKAVEQIKELLKNLKAELIEPVMIKGHPKSEDFKKLDILVEEIYRRHKDAGILNE